MSVLTFKAIPFGVKNANGRIYTKESIKNIPDKVPIEISEDQNAEYAYAGFAEVEIKDDGIYVKSDLSLKDNYILSSGGTGTINQQNEIVDFELMYFTIIPIQTWAWWENSIHNVIRYL